MFYSIFSAQRPCRSWSLCSWTTQTPCQTGVSCAYSLSPSACQTVNQENKMEWSEQPTLQKLRDASERSLVKGCGVVSYVNCATSRAILIRLHDARAGLYCTNSICVPQVLPKLTSVVRLVGCAWSSCGDGAASARDEVMLPRASFKRAASSSRTSCVATVSFTCAVRFSFCCCIRVILRWKKRRKNTEKMK